MELNSLAILQYDRICISDRLDRVQ